MLTDAHAHLNDSAYIDDLDAVVSDCLNNGVGIIVNSAWDLDSSIKASELAEKYPHMYFTVGIHPHNVPDAKDSDLYKLMDLTKHDKCVAWGETGLDYHYDQTKKDIQKAFFKKQIDIANQLGMPLVLHLRDAYGDANEIISAYSHKMNNGVLLHCYSGSMELARDMYNKLDFYYSFGGAITFNKNNKSEVLKVIPEDRLMLETDCPYMTPVPYRGKRNTPAYLSLVRDKMAENLNKSPDYIEQITYRNLLRFYHIEDK